MEKNKTIIAVIVILVVLIGGYFLLKGPEAQAPVGDTSATSATVVKEVPIINQNVIFYTDDGYSPSELKVGPGTTVTWQNNGSTPMWPASASHPSHTVYSGTSLADHCPDVAGTAFDACDGIKPGDSWSFMFTKEGTWSYHDHLKSGRFGKIIVE